MKRRNIRGQYQLLFVHKLLISLLVIMAVCMVMGRDAYHLTYGEQATIPFLPEGDYAVDVTYTGAGKGSRCILYSEQVVSENNLTGEPLAEETLTEYAGIARLQLHLEKGTYSIETKITPGDVAEIQRIVIQSVQLPNNDAYFLAALFLLLALITFCLGSYVPLEKYRTIAILVGIGVVASFPLFCNALMSGHDIEFHLARIEGIYQALRAGEFPVKVNPIQAAGYGSLSATMYPQLFLYPFALLRFVRVSLMLCFKLLLLCMNIVAALLAYFSARRICHSERIGWVCSLLYTFSLYRLNDVFYRCAVGEALAMTFLPLVLWGCYEVFWGDRRKWYLLMLGMTAVVQSHVLTTEICVVLLAAEAIIFLVSRRKTETGKRILSCLKAAVCTLLLNISFLVPFLYFSGQELVVLQMDPNVPDSVVYFTQMFTNYMKASGHNIGAAGSTQGEMPLTVGAVLLVGAILFCFQSVRKKEADAAERAGRQCLLFSAVCIVFCSYLFPWIKLYEVPLFHTLTAPLQYTWRMLSPVSMLLCIPAAVGVVRTAEDPDKKWIYGVMGGLLFLSTTYFFDSITDGMDMMTDKVQVDGTDGGDTLYMFYTEDARLNYYRGEAVVYNKDGVQVTYSGYKKKGNNIRVHVSAEEQTQLYLPDYYIPGYYVEINGEKQEALYGETLVSCVVPKGESDIYVWYEGLPWMHVTDAISGITLLGLAGYGIWKLLRHRKRVVGGN